MGKNACKLTGKIDLDLFQAVMEAVAEKLPENIKATVKKNVTVTAMDNSEEHCLFGITTTGDRYNSPFMRGMGIKVEDNKVMFVGDSWGHEQQWKDFQESVTQTYSAVALQRVAKALGRNVTMTEQDGKMFVRVTE